MNSRPLICVLAAVGMLLPLNARAQSVPSIDGIWEPTLGAPAGHPPEADVSLTTEGRAEFERFSEENDPTLKCIMPGVPLGVYDPYPLEIIQQDHQIALLYEHFHMVRRIFMDGRQAPEDWWPSLVGFSVGRWEGDTLVVQTAKIDWPFFDDVGTPQSMDVDIVERFALSPDASPLDYEITDHRSGNLHGDHLAGRFLELGSGRGSQDLPVHALVLNVLSGAMNGKPKMRNIRGQSACQ